MFFTLLLCRFSLLSSFKVKYFRYPVYYLLILLSLVAPCALKGWHGPAFNNSDTALRAYFINAIKSAAYPRDVEDSILTEELQYFPITSKVENAFSNITMDEYFALHFKEKPPYSSNPSVDSLYSIVRGVHTISNYSWKAIPGGISMSEFRALPVDSQFMAMRDFNGSGLCGEFANFCTKVCEHYGFKVVTLDLKITGLNGDTRFHNVTVALAAGRWYLLESTTGQMFVSQFNTFLSYSQLVDFISRKDFRNILTTEAVNGRFIQPASAKSYSSAAWPYGHSAKPALLDSNARYVVVQTKRTFADWQKTRAVKHTYLRYLKEAGYEPVFFYMYDKSRIAAVNGRQDAVALFKAEFL